MTTTQDEPVAELSTEECWELLELEQFGRLAYRLVDEVHLVPINYAADAGALLFRTASGNKLLAAALHSDVAFEIDWHDEVAAWSVVVRGRLHRLAEDEAERVEGRLPQSWIPTPEVRRHRAAARRRHRPPVPAAAPRTRSLKCRSRTEERRSAMWDMEPTKDPGRRRLVVSDAALRYAVAEARRRGCGIHVVHVDRLTIWSNVRRRGQPGRGGAAASGRLGPGRRGHQGREDDRPAGARRRPAVGEHRADPRLGRRGTAVAEPARVPARARAPRDGRCGRDADPVGDRGRRRCCPLSGRRRARVLAVRTP